MKQGSFDFFDFLFVNIERLFLSMNSSLKSAFQVYNVMIDVLMKSMRSNSKYLADFLRLSLLVKT